MSNAKAKQLVKHLSLSTHTVKINGKPHQNFNAEEGWVIELLSPGLFLVAPTPERAHTDASEPTHVLTQDCSYVLA